VKVAETSKQAYQDILESGRVGRQAKRVFKAVVQHEQPPTINELSKGALAGMEKSTISARLNKLEDEGLLSQNGKRPDKWTGRNSYVWTPMIQEVQAGE